MRVVIFGAAGKTGRLVVDRALAMGMRSQCWFAMRANSTRRAYALLQETRQRSTTC